MDFIRRADELRDLQAAGGTACACSCGIADCSGWESLSEDRWPAPLMQQIATLRDPDLTEPPYEELHPQGTRYGSPSAPVAMKFFPYNRCDVWRCAQCRRVLLRYTEFGGYYVDHRVRELSPDLPLLD